MTVVAGLMLLHPAAAHAWWNKDWQHRVKIEIAAGVAAAELIPVRLHIGDFRFESAKPDGADLRFIAGDDKTPLNFHFESYDSAEQIAVAWVRVSAAANPGPRAIWLYYGNRAAESAAKPETTYDASDLAILHFAEKNGVPRDSSSFSVQVSRFSGELNANGVADRGARLEPIQSLAIPFQAPSGADSLTFSGWVKVFGTDAGLLVSRGDNDVSLVLGLKDGRLYAEFAEGDARRREEAADQMTPGKWQHIALVWSDQLKVFLGGKQVLSVPVRARPLSGDLVIGAHPYLGSGFAGQIDEIQLSSAGRSDAWIAAAASIQDPNLETVRLFEENESSASSAYVAILKTLANAVSLDGWIIIALIGVFGLISGEVTFSKFFMLRRIEKGNKAFLDQFRALAADPTSLLAEAQDASQELRESPLFMLYRGGVEEFRRQRDLAVAAGATGLSPAHFEVIKANIDTTIVNESNRMNNLMVLLTLSVSAAPFLGLLGTVVGIMITFGAIALAGDVNVNTIAPGVAAALATTVAGLIVAIPVLFAYNYLATRIREFGNAMDVFANELVGRLATAKLAVSG